MRIQRIAAPVAVLLAALGCGSDTPSGPKVGPAARLDVSTAPATTAPAGSAGGTFAVKAVDAAGAGVSGSLVSFSTVGAVTVSPVTAMTDASGVASTSVTIGTAAGPATVRASVAGVTTAVSATINIVAGPVVKIAVSPKTARLLSLGDTVRITASAQDQYGNPATGNAITYLSATSSIATVDGTGLVKVVGQGGTSAIIASSNGKADTTVVTVLAAGASPCTGLATATPMNIGDLQTLNAAQYGCFTGSTAGAEYGIVAFNSSTDAANALSVSVTGLGLGALSSSYEAPFAGSLALRSVSTRGLAAPQANTEFHLDLMTQARARFAGGFSQARAARQASYSRSTTGFTPTANRSVIPATAKVGDIIRMNVSAGVCDSTNHPMRVAAIGTKSIVLADTLNPVGGFTDADYTRFAARFDTLVYPLGVNAFGPPSDQDGNGKVAILFTRSVNELTPVGATYYVGGFFNPRDLFPKVDTSNPRNNCPGSNEGEMFYMLVPAPDGINGVKHTAGFVDSITTGVIAHEFQHLINAGYRLRVGSMATAFEETWLNEGLSHIAEELLYYRESGVQTRVNLTTAGIRDTSLNRDSFNYWKSDAASNFARLLSYLRNPGATSPIGADDELATRGASWSFLRYAADRLGTSDGTLWQRLAQSDMTGLATLQSGIGTDPLPLFRDWTVANFVDDLGISSDTKYMHRSWNFRDIYSKNYLNFKTYQLKVTDLPDKVKADFTVRGASASYMRLAVPAGKEGFMTFSSGGGAPTAPLQFIVVRTK